MNIHEATMIALEDGKFIARTNFKDHAKIQPTNGIGGCILSMVDNSKEPRGGWQPSADDLIADDWTVIEGDYGKYTTAKIKGITIEL